MKNLEICFIWVMPTGKVAVAQSTKALIRKQPNKDIASGSAPKTYSSFPINAAFFFFSFFLNNDRKIIVLDMV